MNQNAEHIGAFEFPKEWGIRIYPTGYRIIEAIRAAPHTWTWTKKFNSDGDLAWVSESGDSFTHEEFSNYLRSGGYQARANGYGWLHFERLVSQIAELRERLQSATEAHSFGQKVPEPQFRSYFVEELDKMNNGTKIRIADSSTIWRKREGVLVNENDAMWVNDRPPFVTRSSQSLAYEGQLTIVETQEPDNNFDEDRWVMRVWAMWEAYMPNSGITERNASVMLKIAGMMIAEQD